MAWILGVGRIFASTETVFADHEDGRFRPGEIANELVQFSHHGALRQT